MPRLRLIAILDGALCAARALDAGALARQCVDAGADALIVRARALTPADAGTWRARHGDAWNDCRARIPIFWAGPAPDPGATWDPAAALDSGAPQTAALEMTLPPDGWGWHAPEQALAYWPAWRALLPANARCSASAHAVTPWLPPDVVSVVLGPWALTATKPGYGPALGAAGVRRFCAAHPMAPAPVLVGGVTVAAVPELVQAGAGGLAILGALHEPGGVRAVEALRRAIDLAMPR